MATRKSVFEQIKSGLEDTIAYSRGKLSLTCHRLARKLPAAAPKKRRANNQQPTTKNQQLTRDNRHG